MKREQAEQFEDFVLQYTGRDIGYHNRNKTVGIEFARLCWEMSSAVEREACAKVCDSVDNYSNPMTAKDCADAIRARGNE